METVKFMSIYASCVLSEVRIVVPKIYRLFLGELSE